MWNNVKIVIGDTNNFIDRLKTFDCQKCPENIFNKVRNHYLSKPEYDLQDIKKPIATGLRWRSLAEVSCAMQRLGDLLLALIISFKY